MKDKKRGKSRKRKQAPFLVLPLIDVDQNQNEKMPTKNPGLRLFTETWVPKIKEEEMKSGENLLRPLTATLEKPQVLDISFITKIDMSLMRKEFLSITNLCRVPLNVSKARRKPLVFSQRRSNANRPLSLPSNAQLKKPSRPTTSEDSWEDETESRSRSRSSAPRKIKMNKAPPSAIPKQRKTNAIQQNDANNNHKPAQNRTKLPEPCKTCGRPNQPERFHSHPVTPTSSKKMEEAVKIPVKNTVQKPVAIKYQSKKSATPPVVKAKNSEETTTPRMPSGKGPRTLTCYICGREFGTKSLPLHEPKCMEKWKRENESLPQHLQRKSPIKPDHPLTRDEWNAFAWESSQSTLVPCHNCGRTFYPDRLAVHQRSCKPLRPQPSSTPTSMSQNASEDITSSGPSTPSSGPKYVSCSVCGRKFGTKSIKFHEPQCLKKWHVQNDHLPPNEREPMHRDMGVLPQSPPQPEASSQPGASERPSSSSNKKPPMFPCYLCGRLFSVNSIYIHEPQCLKKWRIENDKLPPNKRRPVPAKPDVKFTPSGNVDFVGTFHRIWDNHLNELVQCRKCGRKFFPDRIEKHEGVCVGLGIKNKDRK